MNVFLKNIYFQKGNIEGKIVVYNQEWGLGGYRSVVGYRKSGPNKAAKLGAVASLIRTLTGHSLYSLHTGSTVRKAHYRPLLFLDHYNQYFITSILIHCKFFKKNVSFGDVHKIMMKLILE